MSRGAPNGNVTPLLGGSIFWWFSKFQTPRRGATPKYGAENFNFLKIVISRIVGALWLRPEYYDTFLEPDKNDGVTAPEVGRENAGKVYRRPQFAHYFAKSQYFSIKLVLFTK